MKTVLALALALLIAILAIVAGRHDSPVVSNVEPTSEEHVYATWDTMELDKCVAAWLIRRFIDEQATFVLHAQGTNIEKGIAFDIPGATWSRQHRKCTADCIWEDLDITDAAAEKIVEIAHDVELNRWHLEKFPQAQQCFTELQAIHDQHTDPHEALQSSIEYFEALYTKLNRK